MGHLHSYPGAHGACELWAVSWAHLVESVHHQGNLLLYGKVIQQESGWTGSPSANREAALVLARCISVARLPWVLPSSQFLLCEGTIVLFPKVTHTSMNCPVPKAYPYIHESTYLLISEILISEMNSLGVMQIPQSVIHTLAWMITDPEQDWLSFSPPQGTRQPHWVSLFHFASWCLEKAQSADQTCYPVTAATCWAMSPSFFTSSLLSWWGHGFLQPFEMFSKWTADTLSLWPKKS